MNVNSSTRVIPSERPITSFSADTDTEGSRWQRTEAPPFLVLRGGRMLVEVPADCEAHVNGLPVIGLQLVRAGDLVRVQAAGDEGGEVVEFIVGRILPRQEEVEAEDCRCDFTGLPLVGNALRCVCGSVYCLDVLGQLDCCPRCNARLDAQSESLPSEELL